MRCSRETFFAKIVKAVVMESPISAQTSSMLRFRSGSIRKFTLTAFAIELSLLAILLYSFVMKYARIFITKNVNNEKSLEEFENTPYN